MNLPKIVNDMWMTRLLFYRPDPIGYCIIQMDMHRVVEYSKLSVEERQRLKGYTK